jgi:hypothetical protein
VQHRQAVIKKISGKYFYLLLAKQNALSTKRRITTNGCFEIREAFYDQGVYREGVAGCGRLKGTLTLTPMFPPAARRPSFAATVLTNEVTAILM